MKTAANLYTGQFLFQVRMALSAFHGRTVGQEEFGAMLAQETKETPYKQPRVWGWEHGTNTAPGPVVHAAHKLLRTLPERFQNLTVP